MKTNINQMKKIRITLLIVYFATGLQAQIVARPPGGGNYKSMTNKKVITSFLGDREKLQLLQASPNKPAGISKATSLGAKSTIGICTSDNPGMTCTGRNVSEVNKYYMSIEEKGWLCLQIGGVEKGFYGIEVNLIEELGGVKNDDNSGVKEYYIAPAPMGWALLTDMIKIKSSNKKLVFIKELQGGVVNNIFIYRTDSQIESSFTFSNAQVSKVNF